MQGGAGQGVHMPKPKLSIKTEVLGGGAVAEAETEADPPPCTVQLMFFCCVYLLETTRPGAVRTMHYVAP